MERITIQLTKETIEKLYAQAKAQGLSASAYIRQLLIKELK